MASYRNKTVCVVDHGLFVDLASTLAKDFGKVLYWCPWESAFPKSNSVLIGKGLPGVTRIDSIWPSLQEIDLFVFPDVYQGPLQEHLVNLGKRVWGSRTGEDLELDRVASKEHMKRLGIDIGPYKQVHGLDALRDYLREHENQYVKISRTRGDFETFKSKNFNLSEPMLDDLEHRLGAKKKVIDFVVEESIPEAVEVGYDGYTIDGRFPQNAFWGIEIKDQGYIGKAGAYSSLPDRVTDVNSKLASTFKAYQYRGFFSSELRLTKDGKAYSIDPCARMGSPPGELYQMMFTNLSDILWEGAEGRLVEPDISDKWGAELIIHSQWADQHWQAIEFPKSVAENVKLRNRTVIDGKNYVVPQAVGLPEVGAVVATGSTMEEAIKACCQIAEKLEGHCIDTMPEAFDEAREEIEELKTYGIEFNGSEEPVEAPQGELAKLLSGTLRKDKPLSETLYEALGE